MRHIALSLATAFLSATLSQGRLITYTAPLSGGVSAGTGTSAVFYDDVLHTLRVTATFSGLTGTTTAAHIHCCTAPPGNAGAATQLPSFAGFPLGVTAASYDTTLDLTQASSWNPAFVTNNGGTVAGAEAGLASGLERGWAYLNIHTSFAAGGEIRGFLVREPAVPEPATMGMAALALGGLMALRARRKA